MDSHCPAVPGDVIPIPEAIVRLSQIVNKVSELEQQSYCPDEEPVPVLPRKSTALQSVPKLVPILATLASKAVISPKRNEIKH